VKFVTKPVRVNIAFLYVNDLSLKFVFQFEIDGQKYGPMYERVTPKAALLKKGEHIDDVIKDMIIKAVNLPQLNKDTIYLIESTLKFVEFTDAD
jgi:hypothetical protein